MTAQTITPERQLAAQQIGIVFNSVQQYLQGLAHATEDGKLILTEPLNDARKKLQEASYWAIQHVLVFGAPAPSQPAADSQPAEAPAPIGEVDPPQTLPTDNSTGSEPA